MRRGAVAIAIAIAVLPFIASAQPVQRAPVATENPDQIQVVIETPEQRAKREQVYALQLAALGGPREISIGKGAATLHLADGEGFIGTADAAWLRESYWGLPAGEPVEGLIVSSAQPLSASVGSHLAVTYLDLGGRSKLVAPDADAMLSSMQARANARSDAVKADKPRVSWIAVPRFNEISQTLSFAVRIESRDGKRRQQVGTIVRNGRYGSLAVSGRYLDLDAGTFDRIADDLLARLAFNAGFRFEDFDPATDRALDDTSFTGPTGRSFPWILIVGAAAMVIVPVAVLALGRLRKTRAP